MPPARPTRRIGSSLPSAGLRRTFPGEPFFHAGTLVSIHVLCPPGRPVGKRHDEGAQFRASFRQDIARDSPRNNVGLAQFLQTRIQDRGRYSAALLLKFAKRTGAIPQIPEDAQSPAASKEIEKRIDRRPRGRASDLSSRLGNRHLRAPPSQRSQPSSFLQGRWIRWQTH